MPNFEQPVDNQSAERQVLWEAKLADVKRYIDGIGGEMDEGIIETVTALNLHGLPTSGSCEGHIGHGVTVPWVDIDASMIGTRYNNQAKISERILNKYGIKREDVEKDEWHHVWIEMCDEFEKAGETEEFKQHVNQNMQYRVKVEQLIDEYYQNVGKEVAGSVYLEEPSRWGNFRLYTGGSDYKTFWDQKKLNPEELHQIQERLPQHQAEMRRFTEFLKERFFTNDSENSKI